MRILIVDDEAPLLNLLQASFQRSGYSVVTASNGTEALEIFHSQQIDLVLLDVIMPDVDGFSVCQEMRSRSDVPIVILSAMNRPDDIVHGFDMGADDYIPKPFTFREVEVRLQAILRRLSWIEEKPTFRVIAFGDITLNDDDHIVTVRGETVDLTPIEYQLLHNLMMSPDRPVSKIDLFKSVWGYDEAGGTNLVEVAVRRLREKIEYDPSKPSYLVTVRGVGYKFDANHHLRKEMALVA
ncbi:MAG: response regulator transcription factor [Chloroflexota bacterium]